MVTIHHSTRTGNQYLLAVKNSQVIGLLSKNQFVGKAIDPDAFVQWLKSL